MKICIATSTRADWGLLSPLAKELRSRQEVQLQILATNMHLLPQFGETISEIYDAGFDVDAKVTMNYDNDSDLARATAMAQCIEGSARALDRLRPDILIILGDRFEMLAIASAACVMKVPIAHIAGGEISQGAIDDNIRHAITKLSSLHFTSTEVYRERVIQMGEAPNRVINAGSLGVWNIMHQPLMTVEQLQESLDFNFTPKNLIIATYHPVTLGNATDDYGCESMLRAFDDFKTYDFVLTYPNNDAGSERIIAQLNKWAEGKSNVKVIKSLGMIRYLSLASVASMVVGNSSSGIVEIPSIGVPTVDIGTRQKGRITAPATLSASAHVLTIRLAMKVAIMPHWQELAAKRINPYANPDTVRIIADSLTGTDVNKLLPKTFYDK